MDKEILGIFNLPLYIKGKTFAEASKEIEKRFKDREDKVSLNTKKDLMQRLANAQEYTKSKLNNVSNDSSFEEGGFFPSAEDATSEDYMNAANTLLDFGENIFSKPNIDVTGNTNVSPDNVNIGGSTLSSAMKGAQAGMAFGGVGAAIGGGIGAITGLIGGNKAKKAALKAAANYSYKQNNQFNSDFALGGTLSPGCGGPGEPPCPQEELNTNDTNEIRKLTGAPLTDDLIKSLFYKKGTLENNKSPLNFGKYKKVNYFNIDKQNGNEFNISNTKLNPHNRDTMKGLVNYLIELNPDSKINFNYNSNFENGGEPDPPDKNPNDNDILPIDINMGDWNPAGEVKPRVNYIKYPDPKTSKYLISDIEPLPLNKTFNGRTQNNQSDNKFNLENASDLLRYAPVASNLYQLLSMKKPKHESLDRLDARYKPNLVDEQSLQNKVINEYGNTADALANSSSGSVGNLRTNLLGAQLNKTRGLSDAYLKAEQLNNIEKSKAQEFNVNVDKVNLQQSNAEKDINARNKGAYESNKSRLISQLGNDIGNIGLEEMRKKYPEKMGFMYDSKGNYIGRIDESGKFISTEQDKKGK